MINYPKIIRETIKECEVKTGTNFGLEVFVNEKLTKVLGKATSRVVRDRYTGEINYVPIKIQISKKFIEIATEDELCDVVKHEYAHCYVYSKVGDHTHDSKEFIECCKKMNTSPDSSYSTEQQMKLKYDVFCDCCKKRVGGFSKKGNVIKSIDSNKARYTSSCCDSALTYIQNW